MKFYRYWASAEAPLSVPGENPRKVSAYGGSNEGLEEAKRRAQEIATRAASALATGKPKGSYAYGDRALREELVREVTHNGALAGAITRNAYGSLVLNTSRVMFVDVDYHAGNGADLGAALRSWWGRLRGNPSQDEQLLTRFDQFTQSHPSLALRVYRTAAGFRLAATSRPFDAAAEETQQVLSELGSDPLYIRLCRSQECFRARLTPKFWRCGAVRPPSRFPWSSTGEEEAYRAWENEYHRIANSFATCAFVTQFGETAVHDEVAPILEIHDRLTIQEGAPLA